ncbi:MAG: DNA polymerase III subunit gamma/tau [Pseudodesulfovibrio sp.]|nr:DNA polymerase III subunit gamma/tau [Pseudodesulfovibrio sp.]
MSTSNLTAKYRPQTFADVAGQSVVKAILSRAAAQDKIAPAYLFSGTRGVGKTTIARIFAKALNCVNAPTGEPCNECSNCKQITAGVAVDVIEIDGASNRGIDDARRLKEDIGYAPVECRYKVFIIDEAHMLTKEAFNALLKTLEEPPPRATFVLATTEHHKFPATIISRCQHYTFKMLLQSELVDHLEKIMNLEELKFEPGALQIIAKRGAGSVRDSMSLLGQSLAMGEEILTEETVRNFLGLAGQDVFFGLMEAMHSRNLVSVGGVLRQVLDQGLDLGFFLRELTTCWRNMFLLRQAGEEALPLLGFSGEEAKNWMNWAGRFEPAHIHACWQMTLDGQRKVMTSLEPALALELLLLNLTCLPDLISLESMAAQAPTGNTPPQRPAPGNSGGGQFGGQQGGGAPRGMSGQGGMPSGGQRFSPPNAPSAPPQVAAPKLQSPPVQNADLSSSPPSREPEPVVASEIASSAQSLNRQQEVSTPSKNSIEEKVVLNPLDPSPSSGPRDWNGFLRFVEERNGQSGVKVGMLHLTEGKQQGNELVVTCKSKMLCAQLTEKQTLSALDTLTRKYFGPMVEVRVETGDIAIPKTDKQLRDEAENHPGVIKIMDSFNAQMVSVSPRKQ